MDTDGHSFQAPVLLSLESERHHTRLGFQGHTWEVFPSLSHYSALYHLKATSDFRAQSPKQVGRTWVAI